MVYFLTMPLLSASIFAILPFYTVYYLLILFLPKLFSSLNLSLVSVLESLSNTFFFSHPLVLVYSFSSSASSWTNCLIDLRRFNPILSKSLFTNYNTSPLFFELPSLPYMLVSRVKLLVTLNSLQTTTRAVLYLPGS